MFNVIQSTIVKGLRTSGKALDILGRQFEAVPYVEKLQPPTRAIKLGSHIPVIKGAFVASTASVIGKVQVGSSSSIWYGAIVRGDVNSITIGDGVTIGDRVMIHCSAELPTIIGDRSVVGAGAICHGCVLEEESMVGAGAQVMDGARVQRHGVLAPGGILSMKKVIPSGQMWAGVPAIYLRDLSLLEIAQIAILAKENADLAILHALESVKTWQQIELDEYNYEQELERSDSYYKRLTPEQMSFKLGEVEGHEVPGRILDTEISAKPQDVNDIPEEAKKFR
mmetsp:Transcript_26916/g.25774  ORF Transcript_26916/g.25774 Transcript_26916/m.25774 type:complete len:281 (+) Transcript_26916:144-986(+)|eukprot:CAMPEP_0119042896 /NCGR_PEP_ID=MMETSP1177-20130426/16251_1 /TAXON_ID=2985 /ORGANISM="Ochromonas sp, Strain CCMP1899" /LENGTH=280 /DNA_ID=CAMNT_0007009991 /DNA_START=144 /DNA_END=986 /DNA_ORIENTATION=+